MTAPPVDLSTGRWASTTRRESTQLEGGALIEALAADLTSLSPQLRKAAAYLVRNRSLPLHCRITDFAQLSGTTPVTVVRLAKRYGFRGYYEMKFACLEETTAPEPQRSAVHVAASSRCQAPLDQASLSAALQGAVQVMGTLGTLLLTPTFAQVARWMLDAAGVVVHPADPWDAAMARFLVDAFRLSGIEARHSTARLPAQATGWVLMVVDLSSSDNPAPGRRQLFPSLTRRICLARRPPLGFVGDGMAQVLNLPEGDTSQDLQILAGLVMAWVRTAGALREAPYAPE